MRALICITTIVLVWCCLCTTTDAAPRRSHSKKKDNSVKPLTAQATHSAHIPSTSAVELHHSLRPPHDTSQVYWNYGGSTVLTKQVIRLTPSAQSRRGWIWNDYPLEAIDWEVRFKMQVFSKPHYGGDGMCMWVMDTSHDPAFASDQENNKLEGDVFGMKNTYKGVGVCVDVYDNDSKRNNPSIFVLYNPEGQAVKYNHDNDYEDDAYKTMLEGTNAAHRCVVALRNQETPTAVMVKFLHKVLHVFVDINDGQGFKFCLAVKFDRHFKDHHLAFTAMTGQVGDTHQLTEVSTRYLDSTLPADDLASAGWGNTAQSSSSGAFMYWTVVLVSGCGLLGVCVYELYSYRSQQAAEIHAVHICKSVNKSLLPHYGGHAALTALLLVSGSWYSILLHVALVILRGVLFARGQLLLTPMDIADHGGKVHGAPTLSFTVRQAIGIVVYALTLPVFIYRWFHT